MTNEQILKKAIKKAVKGGFNFYKFLDVCEKHFALEEYTIETIGEGGISNLIQFYFFEGKRPARGKVYKEGKLYELIFSHSFAKAFWGEEIICKDGSTHETYIKSCLDAGMTKEDAEMDWEVDEECITLPLWEYHLQQMVLEEEPLKYLERFI